MAQADGAAIYFARTARINVETIRRTGQHKSCPTENMKHITGIGGIFFKAKDPGALATWYRQHLGIEVESWGGFAFDWSDDPQLDGGTTAWTIFPDTTKYFEPSDKPFMINFRVTDLDGLLAALRDQGVEVKANDEESEFGKFAWVMDPEGNRLELWEPPAQKQ
jgi:predicted enzyme related to lactoylglutathione lyase